MTEHAQASPQSLLPLKPLVFEIILVLRERDLHGYDIVKKIAGRGLPGPRLFPASLYRTLRTMRSQGLIEETKHPPGQKAEDERRRYFRLTPFGERVAGAEALRLERQVLAARAGDLLPRSEVL